MRPIKAQISASALQHNLNVVKQHAPESKIMAVVKANAYGHGLIGVARALNAADGFAVLDIAEAIDLREAGFAQTILLLEGVFHEADLQLAASFAVDIVVHNEAQVAMLLRQRLLRPINVHVKMDTGMHRLGFSPDTYLAAVQQLKSCQNVRDLVLMTHFATADQPQGVALPLQQFKSIARQLPYAQSLANSAAILLHPDTCADWVRPGIMLYGASPVSGVLAQHFNLKPAMRLTSEIIAIQTLAAGESAGYGNRFTATRQTRLGIVACGYADGYPRHAGQYPNEAYPFGLPIAVNGSLTQTLGRVSMDMLFCDLTDIPAAQIGAPVELWGDLVPVDTVAEMAGTVGYELLCAVSSRVPIAMVA